MLQVVKENGKTYIVDANGRLQNIEIMDKNKLAEAKMMGNVERLVHDLAETIESNKVEIETELYSHLEALAAERGEKWNGNATIYSFDEGFRLVLKSYPTERLTPTAAIALTKLRDYLKDATESVPQNIRAIIEGLTDLQNNKASVRRAKDILKVKIDDERWEEATSILAESIETVAIKPLLSFERRNDNGDFEPITLNFNHVNVRGQVAALVNAKFENEGEEGDTPQDITPAA